MIIVFLVFLGLILGSFVNALVWRLHEQETVQAKKKPNKTYLAKLSIRSGRSMCPDCHHELSPRDLIPVISWLSTRGNCRYCHKSISVQYPVVELSTALIFVASYIWWPVDLAGAQIAIFALWLCILVGFVALIVYDFKWMLLPNRIVYPLTLLAAASALINIAIADKPVAYILNAVLAVLIGGGIFYVIYQVSDGKWIGGGDVKLGWLLGLIVATPARAFLMIFLAALGGSLVSLPLLLTGKLKRSSNIPFGPFLIMSTIAVVLFGADILDWYRQTFLSL